MRENSWSVVGSLQKWDCAEVGSWKMFIFFLIGLLFRTDNPLNSFFCKNWSEISFRQKILNHSLWIWVDYCENWFHPKRFQESSSANSMIMCDSPIPGNFLIFSCLRLIFIMEAKKLPLSFRLFGFVVFHMKFFLFLVFLRFRCKKWR